MLKLKSKSTLMVSWIIIEADSSHFEIETSYMLRKESFLLK